jgi:choline-sulfatase
MASKKKSFFIGTLILLVLAAIPVYYFLHHGPPVKRLRFSVAGFPATGDESGKKPDLESGTGNFIHSGQILRFEKAGVLSLKPGVSGKRGLFFTFQVRSRDTGNVKTILFLKRKARLFRLKSYIGRTYYHSFSRELEFLKDDEIHLELQGSGMIILNNPVLYVIPEKQKRDYVFVVAPDTLRVDRIGASRNGILLTPNISEFKKDCCEFENAFAQSSWTLPSFMSFFTGLYEFHHQITRDTSLAENKPFLVEQLSEKFFTVNFNANLWMLGKFGFSRGFDFFSVHSSPTDSYGGKVLFSNAIHFLKKTRLPSLFMFLHTYQIHSPYAPPPEFLKRIIPEPRYRELDSFFYKKQFNRQVSPEIRENMKALYDAEIYAFDSYFGDFIRALKDMGIYDQSLIVFLSDHGEEFLEHGGWAHCHSMYDEVIKVPLFIKFPRNRYRAEGIKENVGLIDVLPTILDYYHIKNDLSTDGLSLLPLLKNKKLGREKLLSSTSISYSVKDIPPKYAILIDGLKIIYNFKFSRKNLDYFSEFGLPPKTEPIQVFDIQADPQETSPFGKQEKTRFLKRFLPDINLINGTINIIMKQRKKGNVTFSQEDKQKLKSLGYL